MNGATATRSLLRKLPLTLWATPFSTGRFVVQGRVADHAFRLDIAFTGGVRPVLGPLQRDGEPIAAAELGACLDGAEDLAVEGEAVAAQEIRVAGNALADLLVPRGARVHLAGRLEGPSSAPRLAAPIRLRCEDCRIDLRASRWLSERAAIRLTEVALHPDGRVVVTGASPGLLQGPVRHALTRVSADLTRAVRSDPRWRPFLAGDP
jgi:hypothetical protein